MVFLSSLQLTNFKRFTNVSINLSPSPKVIIGRNGAGKTQLLWALVFYFRAYNTRVVDSQWHNNPFAFSSYEALFGEPLFRDANDLWKTFVRQNANPQEFILTGGFVDGSSVSFTYAILSGLVLKASAHTSPAKIRYAFMQPVYQWGHHEREITGDSNFLTTGVQHLRSRLDELGDQGLQFIESRLNEFGFIVKLSRGQSKAVMVTEDDGVKLEIGACGSALQKIVAIYVFFCALRDSSAAQRVLMIDEPEALLYDYVVERLIHRLICDCADAQIQLIMTSNSHTIISRMPENDRVVLASSAVGFVLDRDSALYDSELAQISSSSRPLLIVDGPNDIFFYRKFVPALADSYQFVAMGNRDGGWPHRKTFVELIGKSATKLDVCFLKDSELLVQFENPENLEGQLTQYVSAKVALSRLPCVESFLLMNTVFSGETTELTEECAKLFLRKATTATYFVNIYYSSVVQLKKAGIILTKDADVLWEDVMTILNTSPFQWKTFFSAVRGHDLVEQVLHTTAMDLMTKTTTLHPDVQALLDETVKNFRK